MPDNTRPRQAVILGVGDELLRGDILDANTPFLARTLREHGWSVVETRILPDDLPGLAQALVEASERAELVLTTGGLGPTEDDMTRQAAALAVGCEVQFDHQAWSWVLEWYERMQREVPASNRRQALVPELGSPLPNLAGTAPGLRMPLRSATLFCLPGPPREVRSMVSSELEPWLLERSAGGPAVVTKRVYFASLSESQFADAAGDLLLRRDEALVGVTADQGRLAVTMTCTDPDEQRAEESASALQAQMIELFPEHVYSLEESDMAQVLGGELIAKNVQVSVAESCTLGLIAAALGGVSGISSVLSETYCTYADSAKARTLGVDVQDLEVHGAVSEPVVRQMALGALERSGADLAIAVSGVAGPGGGSAEKPVGMVWFAIAWKGQVVEAQARHFPPATREQVRAWATHWALFGLLRTLREHG